MHEAKEICCMPDGDKVHEKLGWRYQKSYKMLCEGQAGSDVAAELAQAVSKDVKQGGDDILNMLLKMGAQLEDILRRRKRFEEVDWRKEAAYIIALDRYLDVDSRLKALAVEACQEGLHALRYGAQPSNCAIELLTGYLDNICDANFMERVSLTPNPDNTVSHVFVREQLEQLRPLVKERLIHYAQAIYKNGTVHLARRPQRKNAKTTYTIDTDVPITAIGA